MEPISRSIAFVAVITALGMYRTAKLLANRFAAAGAVVFGVVWALYSSMSFTDVLGHAVLYLPIVFFIVGLTTEYLEDRRSKKYWKEQWSKRNIQRPSKH